MTHVPLSARPASMAADSSIPAVGASRIRRTRSLALFLVVLSMGIIAVGTCIGSTGLSGPQSWRSDPIAWQIIVDIRLPRTLGAWAAGALLGVSGAIAQGLFRNPLADPYLLGSASGALLAVALAMALLGVSPLATEWLTRVGLSGAAFIGAVLAVLLTLSLARGVQHTLRLLLAGVIVGVVLGALSSMTVLWNPEIMQAHQTFMLGGTAFIGWSASLVMLVVWLLSIAAAALLSPALDALALGEATALSLGLPLPALRATLIVVMALATGAAVAQTGLIAFVGLAAPHLVRSVVKTTHGALIALASLAGGALLSAADLIARAAIAPRELPVGVLTALLGGGYLLWLMHRRSRRGSGL